ncbi:CRISPR-associated helicase Cas3' [Hungatella sp. SB206]|uniref:CRISPR-associated helicase Cas3' n=1 Tax=Hungatella sp. SB206 TaxID=2937758 RepID=UPI003DAA41AE
MYLAHISQDKTRKQSVNAHCHGTAKLAGDFASAFNCREWGFGCGLIHDIGKYSDKFQKRLQGGSITDHATAGAQELYKRKNIYAAYCISGHHSGLLNGGTRADCAGEATLMGRLKKGLEDYHAFEKEIEIPAFPVPALQPLGEFGFTASFFIRMLFSCLVDGDYLDTESFMAENPVPRGTYDTMADLFQRVQDSISPWLTNTDRNTVNGRRTEILKACLETGKEPSGLFQLTVPTGGGKTVSSLAFALQHAIKYEKQHIIYVIPYTSIIEQNAAVFKHILGPDNVLEDHCNVVFESEEELMQSQLAAENWDKPVIVTTNVQFFESLFSNKTSKCRKLHNIANSVIIFDEAQMLPVRYLQPCIRAITELIVNYRCSSVLCTATQPSLQQFFPETMKCKEICPDVRGQYEFFKRTDIQEIGKISEEELASLLRQENQVLCILNSRRQVQRVYEAVKGEGTYHLSTLMYPEHRKKLLQEIRDRLIDGKACRLIATSLVEAGVDFDFQTVYRELAGIDSVIQAAGRCNREGKRSREECHTMVFTLGKTEGIHLPAELKQPIAAAEQTAEKYDDIASLEAIHEYFKRLYYYKGDRGLDVKGIVDQLEKGGRTGLFPFADVAKAFCLIEDGSTKTILVDREPEAQDIVARIRRGEHSRQLVREAGHYCVNVYEQDFEKLNGAGKLEALDLKFYRLRNSDQYTEEMGLVLNVERGEAVFL